MYYIRCGVFKCISVCPFTSGGLSKQSWGTQSARWYSSQSAFFPLNLKNIPKKSISAFWQPASLIVPKLYFLFSLVSTLITEPRPTMLTQILHWLDLTLSSSESRRRFLTRLSSLSCSPSPSCLLKTPTF